MRALVISLAFAAATPAAAEQTLDKAPTAESVQTMHGYSRCVALRRERQAAALLAMDYRTEAYRKELQRVADKGLDCVPFSSEARFNGVVFVGGLAEALLERDLKGVALASRVAYDPSRSPMAARDHGEYVGLCVVRTAPDAVARVLAAPPAGKAEEKELKALAPVVSQCLGEGTKARFNKVGLRSLLAIAAYRLNLHNAFPKPAGTD